MLAEQVVGGIEDALAPAHRPSARSLRREHEVVAIVQNGTSSSLPSGASPGSWRSNGAIRELRTPNTASESRYSSPSTNTCVISVWKPSARDHEVHVRGAHRPATAGSSSSPTGPSAGIGYASGLTDQNQKRPSSRWQMAAPARLVEVVVLDVVEAVLVGLPDLDPRAGDGLAVDAHDAAVHQARLAAARPSAMSSPLAKAGEPSTKNGPNTVDSVASGGRRWLSPTTSIDSPSTSESRMNSWRLSSVMWPVRVRKSIPANHSSSVSCDLGANACRWLHEAAAIVLKRSDRRAGEATPAPRA